MRNGKKYAELAYLKTNFRVFWRTKADGLFGGNNNIFPPRQNPTGSTYELVPKKLTFFMALLKQGHDHLR